MLPPFCETMNTLPAELLTAYLQTSFNVLMPAGTITLRCGRHSIDLDRLLKDAGASCWAYLTAYNPNSQQLGGDENRRRQDKLVAEVSAKFSVLHGEGVGADQNWPPEPSVLVLGMDREEAMRVGSRYGQNAVVVGVQGQPAELLICMAQIAEENRGTI